MVKFFVLMASVMAFIAVAVGAFGAHMLRNHLNAELMAVFETAARYHMYHALALGIVAFSLKIQTGTRAIIAGWLFITGIILFCGSLYTLSITGIKWFGAITPFGGIAFLAGWIYIAAHVLKGK